MAGTTLRKLVYNVRTLIKDVHSDDIKFTDRNIAFWIGYLRAKVIKQEADKSRPLSSNITQTIPVTISDVDQGIRIGEETGETESRSGSIPSLVNSNKGNLLTGIYGIDNNPIVIQAKAKAIRNKHNKYGKKFPVAFLDGQHIYFISCSMVGYKLFIEGVFQDPLEALKLENPGLSEDELWDLEYPIDSNTIDMINSLIKSNELNLYFQLQEDKLNNSQNNSL